MRSARILVGAACLAGSLALAVGAPPTLASANQHLGFRIMKLAGSSGRSEPRDTITPDGRTYVDTNDENGNEVVYASSDRKNWSLTTMPPNQTLPTTDVDLVSTRTGRLVA